MQIIGLGHRRRMGKSTCSRFMLQELKMEHRRFSVEQFGFADKVKAIAFQMYAWGGLEEGIYYESHPEQKEAILPAIGKSPRDIWIELGEDGRRICPKTWAEAGLYDKDCEILICYDLRDRAEAEYVKKFNGYVLRINDPRVTHFNDSADSALSTYDEWDGHVENCGTLKDLNLKIKDAVQKILNNERGWKL